MGEPILLFGIGATKAGTSWLFDYLSRHPECSFRNVKELHHFDILENPNSQWSNWRPKELRRKLARMESALHHANPARKAIIARNLADLKEWLDAFESDSISNTAYLDFLLKNCDANTKVVGDITPSYSTLSSDSFQVMANMTPTTKFIYLLRDPLDRLWSNIRMSASRTSHKADYADRAGELTEKYISGEHHALAARTDYKSTLTRLLEVVPRSHVFVAFFENLFVKETMQQLTNFLKIAPLDADFDTFSNKGKPLEMDGAQQQAVLRKLRPQYEYVRDFFDGQIPALWQKRMDQMQVVGV